MVRGNIRDWLGGKKREACTGKTSPKRQLELKNCHFVDETTIQACSQFQPRKD